MIRLLLILLLVLGFEACAADIYASSPAYSDVTNAIASAAAGDTVHVPAGSATWTQTVLITNAINFVGAGTNTATGTVIIDGINSETPFLNIGQTAYTNRGILIANFQFTNSVGFTKNNGAWKLSGCNTNRSWCVISNVFHYKTRGPSPFISGSIGVFTHCRWLNVSGIPIYLYHENWNGVANSAGSWADTIDWTDPYEWVVVEDSLAELTSGAHYAFIDAYRGARYIVRYTTLGALWLEAHGSDSGGVLRGTRAVGSYYNTFIGQDGGDYVHNIRSGTHIAHHNTVTNYLTAANFAHLDYYRRFHSFSPWGFANGTNDWDINLPGGPFDTGTATSGSGVHVLVDSTKAWTNSGWVGYSIINHNALNDKTSGYIIANTATSITVSGGGAYPAGAPTEMTFAAGDTYSIYKVTEAFDQPGRGGGTQLGSGDPPTIPVIPYDQIDVPCYEWNNTGEGGVDLDFSSAVPIQIRSGEHYFNDTVMPGYTDMVYPHPFLSAGGGGSGGGSGHIKAPSGFKSAIVNSP